MQKIIFYRDLEKEKLHGYEIRQAKPGDLVVKQGVLPAAYGFPAMHISHIVANVGLIVALTDYELTNQKKREIEQGAINFATQYDANNSSKN